jgi:hypothetical protein
MGLTGARLNRMTVVTIVGVPMPNAPAGFGRNWNSELPKAIRCLLRRGIGMSTNSSNYLPDGQLESLGTQRLDLKRLTI